MNCCNDYGDCRQGRDCPARMQGAKVAKIKRRTPDKQALPATAWRAYMRHLAKWMLIVWAMLIAVPLIVSLARGLT